MHANEQSAEVSELDHIIELSLLKIRRLQICSSHLEERSRLLIMDTLHGAVRRKTSLLQEQGLLLMEVAMAYNVVLQDSLRKLGLGRILRVYAEPSTSGLDAEPKIRVPVKGARLRASMLDLC